MFKPQTMKLEGEEKKKSRVRARACACTEVRAKRRGMRASLRADGNWRLMKKALISVNEPYCGGIIELQWLSGGLLFIQSDFNVF